MLPGVAASSVATRTTRNAPSPRSVAPVSAARCDSSMPAWASFPRVKTRLRPLPVRYLSASALITLSVMSMRWLA